ncbi:Fascin-like incomplete domain containing protein [Pandoravirus salinus]|uniref:Fascin-like incomplete domain containing protein n=1 Tax=Pandoravirus salinus TaxID=1349410 RepID=A0A291ATM7_9VIRU|nr:Fascin-like incomplete domain [Pandoravirus salinus]ATE82185.1 Fascin-like incomplete domain containing protein [Pandoravirus salinus]
MRAAVATSGPDAGGVSRQEATRTRNLLLPYRDRLTNENTAAADRRGSPRSCRSFGDGAARAHRGPPSSARYKYAHALTRHVITTGNTITAAIARPPDDQEKKREKHKPTVLSTTMHERVSRSSSLAAFLVLLVCAAATADAYHYTVVVDASANVSVPATATNVKVTLWGAGGGAASTIYCGAGGGSGAAVMNRSVDTTGWQALTGVQWTVTVGQGGAGANGTVGPAYGGYGGDGGDTTLTVVAAGPTQLYQLTAYGGGGGAALSGGIYGCQGGAGGGASSGAQGVVPGGGVPSGAADDDDKAPARQGDTVGDIKAGGAGAGSAFYVESEPYVDGAPWTSPGRHNAPGRGVNDYLDGCASHGGAAGFGGPGGNGKNVDSACWVPAPNTGSGGGSAFVCGGSVRYYADSAGSSGGAIIEYEYDVAPSPSPTPSRSPTRTPSPSPTRTPSMTPTPSSQPWSQYVTFVSPTSGRQLTAQDDGSVASLWVGATYKEKWTVARLSNGKYTIRSYANRYLGADPGGWVRADATAVGSWEQWTILIGPNNQWTFKSTHGTYMGTTAGGVVYLNNNAALYWTKSLAS